MIQQQKREYIIDDGFKVNAFRKNDNKNGLNLHE
jgi:hypothetical protein